MKRGVFRTVVLKTSEMSIDSSIQISIKNGPEMDKRNVNKLKEQDLYQNSWKLNEYFDPKLT